MRRRVSGGNLESAAMLVASATALFVLARKIARGQVSALDERLGRVVGIRECDADKVSKLAKPRSVFLEALAMAVIPGLTRRERMTIVGAPVAVAASGALLKHWVPRERPNKTRFQPKGGQSFPSTHSAQATALTVALANVARNHGIGRPVFAIAASLSALIAIERVRGAAHWPSDVIAGCLLGVASASAVRLAV